MRIIQRGKSLQLVREQDQGGEGGATSEVVGSARGPDFQLDAETQAKLSHEERAVFDSHVGKLREHKQVELKYTAAKFPETAKLVAEWLSSAAPDEVEKFVEETRAPLKALRRQLAKVQTAAMSDRD